MILFDGYIKLNLPDLELGHPLIWPILYSSKDGNCDDGPLFNEELFQEIKPFVHEENKRNNGMSICISSDLLPVGTGLGSSAACSVCLATGLLLVLGHISIPNNNRIDNSVTTYVANVRIVCDKFPQIIDTILDAIENVSVFSKEILEKFDKIADYKLHSKLTGTRGGGCALTLIREVTGVTSMINLKELLGSKICPTIESASEIGTSENYTIKTIEITFLDPSLSKIHLLENSLVRYA
ncbi:7135_t:CDS:10 [Entrophospora sp. SA101]|nr:7135_t:CDS:10 [Entrophospora sp. SA101]